MFPKEFGIHYNSRTGIGFKSTEYCREDLSLQNVEQIFQNFGSRLSKLTISKHLGVVNLIAKYCGGVRLRRFDISKLKSIEGVRLQLSVIFQRLLKLSIEECDLLITSPDLNCDSLVELKIVESSGCVAIMKHTFPNLKRLTWHSSQIYKGNNTTNEHYFWMDFFGRHAQLKTMSLRGQSVCNDQFFHVISRGCKELEELDLRVRTGETMPIEFINLKRMAKLKMLQVQFGCHEFSQCESFLLAVESLETVKMHFKEKVPEEMFDVMSKLQNLSELHLTFCDFKSIPWRMLVQLKQLHLFGSINDFNSSDLVDIIRQLKNLELLEHKCEGNFTLRATDFCKIIRIVHRREHVLTLKCSFEFVTSGYENPNIRLIKQNNDEDSDED